VLRKRRFGKGDFEDSDEDVGTEIGKIGSEGVKIKFKARRKR